jgi:two-component system response regulator YesN
MPDRKPVILIVEDEEAIRASYEVILGDDYDLVLAETAEEALKILDRRADIGLLFLDFQLPGMNGLEFMEKFREKDYDIPVVVVTGKGSEEVAARFSEYQVFRYIVKPFRPRQIIEIVEQILEKDVPQKNDMDFRYTSYSQELPFKVRRAMDFILENFHRNIGINEVAKRVGCTHRHLERLFHGCLGQSPHEVLEKVRMKEEKKLIETTSFSVKIVSQKCGYGSEWHFIEIFKKIFGRTPAEYRKEFSKF